MKHCRITFVITNTEAQCLNLISMTNTNRAILMYVDK